jgi:hypothetical protein
MLQVCYVVVSKGWDRHSQMAWVSAQSVRRQEPNARVVIVVEGASTAAEQEMARRFGDVADAVIPKRSSEATPVAKSRHHKIVLREYVSGDFLYLDSDTLAVAPFADVLRAAGEVGAVADFNFDIRRGWFPKDVETPFRSLGWDYPLPYQVNAGVIFMRDKPAVHRMAQEWLTRFRASTALPHVWDQATFNSALFATKVPHVVLPHAYNAQVVKRNYRFRDAKILHFFGSPEEQRGTVMEHLLSQLERTGTFDDGAYELSIRQRHPWGPEPEAWRLMHSRNYVRAVLQKARQTARVIGGAGRSVQ